MNGVEVQLIQVFQELWGWSALSAAVHCLPIGIAGGTTTYIAGSIAPLVPRRLLLIGGQVRLFCNFLGETQSDKDELGSNGYLCRSIRPRGYPR